MPLLPAASLYFSVDFSIFPLQSVTFQTPADHLCGSKLSAINAVSRKGADQGLTKQNQQQPDPEFPVRNAEVKTTPLLLTMQVVVTLFLQKIKQALCRQPHNTWLSQRALESPVLEPHPLMAAVQPDVGPHHRLGCSGAHHPGAESTLHDRSSFIWKSWGLGDTRKDCRAVLLYPGRHKANVHRAMPCSQQAWLSDMLGAHTGWESLGEFVIHTRMSI